MTALCVNPNVPVDAIFAEDEIPEGQEIFLELNAELADVWPNITEQKEPRQMQKNGMVFQTNSNI